METLSFELRAITHLLLTVGLGGAVGLERELHGRPAGLRTHVLVCVGATIIMLAAKGLGSVGPAGIAGTRITIDPGRIAAGIITGIGFLGAGSIIKPGNFVRGLTTAACLWFVAALGIVIGEGFYGLATISTAIALVILIAFDRIEHAFRHVVYRTLRVVLSLEGEQAPEQTFREILKQHHVRVQDVQYHTKPAKRLVELTFRLRTTSRVRPNELLGEIGQIEGIAEVEWR